MTAPGSIVPPSPGWWVRSDRIGVGQGTYGWSGAAHGTRSPQGHTSGFYGWSGTRTVGVKNVPIFIAAAGNCNSSGAVVIPTHQVGDVIVLYIFSGSINSLPVVPTASGTVPAWITLDADNTGTSGCSSGTYYFVATATTTTTGNWGNCDGIIAAIIRNHGSTPIGAHANTGATMTSIGPTAPTITPTNTDGTSVLLRFFGERPVAGFTGWNSAPSGYTQSVATAEGTWGAVCLDTQNVTTSAAAVSQGSAPDPTGAQYRGATVEIRAY